MLILGCSSLSLLGSSMLVTKLYATPVTDFQVFHSSNPSYAIVEKMVLPPYYGP